MEDCGPLPASACRDAVANAADVRVNDVAGFQIRCTAPVCNDVSGAIDLVILWRDGTSESRTASWADGPFDAGVLNRSAPIPTPPVPPTCANVPDSECQGEWTTAMENLSADQIHLVSLVLIQCTARCTPDSGAGQTIIGFQDGTRIRPSTWSYHHTP